MLRLIPLSLLATGCLYIKTTEDMDHFTVAEPVHRVVVDIDAGSVEIVADGGDGVSVTRTFTWSSEAPTTSWQVVDGTLTLRADCPDVSLGPCSVDHVLTVPGEVEVVVWTGSGDVDVAGTTGLVDIETGSGSVALYDVVGDAAVQTGSGSIRAEYVVGDLRLGTGSGSIDGRELAAAVVDAETGSGSVDLDLVAPIERVVVETGSGSVDLIVPTGTYAVDVTTGSGDYDISGVTIDARAPASLSVTTGSGDVSITGR